MRVGDLAIALRSRQGWEAIDLGFAMARHWSRQISVVWLTVYLPTAVAIIIALHDSPLIAALLLWWLKPVFDRFVLFVLSRCVFGSPPGLVNTLASWQTVLSPGLWRPLLLRPFAWDRSFLQPVPLLERQRGASLRQRISQLGRRLGGHAMGLALVCLCFEVVAMVFGSVGLALLVPAAEIGGVGIDDGGGGGSAGDFWTLRETLLYAFAVMLVEPFYVAAGFSMYLARRTALEGWDIELALRTAAGAVSKRTPSRTAAGGVPLVLLVCLLTAFGLGGPQPVGARVVAAVDGDTAISAAGDPGSDESSPHLDKLQPPAKSTLTLYRSDSGFEPLDTEARRTALEVLEHPDFGQTVERLRWRIKSNEREAKATDIDWLRDVGEFLAAALRVGFWLLMAVVALAVVWIVLKRFHLQQRAYVPNDKPRTLFGLAIAPDSLPDDIGSAARSELAAGRQREAASLLYRGSLSYLVHQCAMQIGDGATEGEVRRLAAPLLSPRASDYFSRLIEVWVKIAYGHRHDVSDALHALCRDYDSHFASLYSTVAEDLPPAAQAQAQPS